MSSSRKMQIFKKQKWDSTHSIFSDHDDDATEKYREKTL